MKEGGNGDDSEYMTTMTKARALIAATSRLQ